MWSLSKCLKFSFLSFLTYNTIVYFFTLIKNINVGLDYSIKVNEYIYIYTYICIYIWYSVRTWSCNSLRTCWVLYLSFFLILKYWHLNSVPHVCQADPQTLQIHSWIFFFRQCLLFVCVSILDHDFLTNYLLHSWDCRNMPPLHVAHKIF
jgi:hypothetical protein